MVDDRLTKNGAHFAIVIAFWELYELGLLKILSFINPSMNVITNEPC